MENNEKVNLYEEANYAKALIDSLNEQIERLEKATEELVATSTILHEDGIRDSPEIRISIGSGIYVGVSGLKFDRVLIPVGSGVLKEESRENATHKIDDNLKEISASLNSLYLRKKDIETRYESILAVLQNAGSGQTG